MLTRFTAFYSHQRGVPPKWPSQFSCGGHVRQMSTDFCKLDSILDYLERSTKTRGVGFSQWKFSHGRLSLPSSPILLLLWTELTQGSNQPTSFALCKPNTCSIFTAAPQCNVRFLFLIAKVGRKRLGILRFFK